MVDISICLPIILIYTVFNPHISNARGVLPGILGRGVLPGSGSKSLPYFRPKNVIFYIRFQTWPLKFHTQIFPQRIYVIITRSPSLLRLEQQQKNHWFGIETINTFIHSRSSLENHTRFQTKMDEVYTRFQTQTVQKPGLFGAAHTVYDIYKGVPPPPPLHPGH